MSFASLTASKRNLRPRFWIQIQGIEPVFVESTLSHVTRTQRVVIPPSGIVVGESRLDFDQFAESGASLTVRLRDTPDRVLRALFASKTRRLGWLTGGLGKGTPGPVTLNVNDSTPFPTAGTAFIGAETFVWSSKATGTTLSSATRAQFGSRAQDQVGDADDGASIYLVPPNWVGRRVELRAVYIDDAGNSDGSNETTLGVFRLEKHPQSMGGDEWELSCGGLDQYFAKARIYVGQREAKPASDGSGFELDADDSIAINGSDAFLFKVGAVETLVRLNLDSGVVLLPPLASVAAPPLDPSDPSSITIVNIGGPVADELLQDALLSLGNGVTNIKSLQHVAYLTGDPTRILLKLLLSMLGDGTNDSSYDVLPGRGRAGFGEEEWRFGAAIFHLDVDITAFEAFIGTGPSWTLFVDTPMTVSDLLLEWSRCVRAFWRVDASGKLTVTKIRDKSTASSHTTTLVALTDAVLLDDEAEAAEIEQGPVSSSAQLTANWDPLSGTFLAVVNVTDPELAALFPEDDTVLTIESKALTVDTSTYSYGQSLRNTLVRANPMLVNEVLAFTRRMILATTRPRAFLQHRFAWDEALVVVGDTVRVTNARVPDLLGGTLSAIDCMVVGRQIDVDAGIVTLRLQVLDRGFRVAPCGVVASWDAGTKTATLSNTDVTGASPGDNFAAGWTVEMLDSSADPNTVASLTITAVTSTTLTFSTAPGFTPAAGDLVLPVDAAGLTASVSGFAPDDFTYQVPAAGTLAVSGVEDPRWS